MAPSYQIIVKDRAGAQVAIITDFEYLTYTKQVNAPGLLQFRIRGNHAAISTFELDGQVEVYRRDAEAGIDWYADFYGLFRMERREASQNRKFWTAFCPGQMDFLRRAIVAYPAGTADRSEFTSDPAETILKNLVTYNATTSGTTGDGRERNVDTWGGNITVEADGAGGSTIDKACAWRPLLSALQEVADAGGLDFDLVKTGAQAWQFRTYTLLGTDRSANVVFSLAYGNMDNVTLERYALEEPTVAIVGGQGTEASRDIVIRTGTNYQASYRSHEVFVSAQQYSTTAGLQAAGDARLYELEARNRLNFRTRDTAAVRYGRDWFVGDKVTGRYEEVEQTMIVDGVTVTLQPDSEEFETIQPRLAVPI